ncbi:hypothetical protein SCB49_09445 [unidentified eubacterium SCB49]|nr:hypothetical protein SCB49_09445 [unidentified eubacterium SCB49]
MKRFFSIFIAASITASLFVSCSEDEPSFGDEIFNDLTNYPYVAIQDRNEDLEGLESNNYWSFSLIAEEGGTQVRVNFDADDPNIIDHKVYVGFDSNDASAPLDTDVLLTTITDFPTELVFTKAEVASALGVPVTDLETGSVYFRGRSIDADDNIVDDPSVFEDYLAYERHAYFYEWPLDQ